MAEKLYRSLDALRPVRKLLDEAGAAIKDHSRKLLASGAPEVLGTVAGIGAGAVSGAALISTGAASGTAGAAALTSGLAWAGGIVGGGMTMGIAVAAAPAVLLGVGGLAGVSYLNKWRLGQERRALLQEAIRKHQAMQNELNDACVRNRQRADYLQALVIKLEDVIRNLRGELGYDLDPEPV